MKLIIVVIIVSTVMLLIFAMQNNEPLNIEMAKSEQKENVEYSKT